MNNAVNFDSLKVKETQKEMYEIVLSITSDLEEVTKVIKDSEEFFDSPSGKHFREVSENLISTEINYLENDVFGIIKKLDDVVLMYSSFDINTKKAVSGDEA